MVAPKISSFAGKSGEEGHFWRRHHRKQGSNKEHAVSEEQHVRVFRVCESYPIDPDNNAIISSKTSKTFCD